MDWGERESYKLAFSGMSPPLAFLLVLRFKVLGPHPSSIIRPKWPLQSSVRASHYHLSHANTPQGAQIRKLIVE